MLLLVRGTYQKGDTMARRLLNTKGAAALLGCSENRIHKLVTKERLKAYIYDESGQLIERPVGTKNQGVVLHFYENDLIRYQEVQARLQRIKLTRPARGRQYTDEQKQRALQLVAQGMSNRKAAQE